ncbi:hypothetical protein BDW59DRAFT_40618 [Aspergillus cavernicola]|uniref:NYN domain-containing protein n=1 Tax=Aspergillus cavernicola TaxID=176166 RepID=A0ABR4IMJ5_9EURO
MPPAPVLTSNWDFTPVINLLRSPTCQSGDLSADDKRCPDHPDPPSPPHRITKYDVEGLDVKEQSLNDAGISSPKLGDFSSLWELLGSISLSPTRKDNESSDEFGKPSKQPRQPVEPVVILKRPSITVAAVEKPVLVPRTILKPTRDRNVTNACDFLPHYKAGVHQPHCHRCKTSHETITSENDTAGESDGYLSVFDPPLSKPQSIPPMVPPQVGLTEAKARSLETPPSSFDEIDGFLTSNAVRPLSKAGPIRLQPLAYKTAADQRVGLLTKLLKDFPDYAETLIQSGHSKKSNKADVSSRPIHVFIDMSNIIVGFHDTIKYSRNIPVKTRIRRVPLSFQNFSLILERGRSTVKRVLVGSDRFAAITKSEQLGYEANILDRVQKIKQLTPRQLKFRRNPRAIARDGGHGSETNDAPEERWVEQGVDEILHLKILESLLDADEPATIVLATGDAAAAEYSGGFMKMVERALQRGWKVELVSFSQVTSYAYRKKEFRSRWGDQFQVIVLDDFIEELLEM